MFLKPAFYKALALVGGDIKSYREISRKHWTLAPAETRKVKPAIYRSQDLDRITAAWNGPSLDWEMKCLLSDTREHAATVAYQLKNVDIADGHIYCDGWKDRLLSKKPNLFADRPDRLRTATLACTFSGNHYFGHWLTDDLTLYLAAKDIGNPFTFERGNYLHEPGYRDLLSIPDVVLGNAHLEELIILQDYGRNEFKRLRYELLRCRSRQHVSTRNAGRILLRRGYLGASRRLVNNEEFERYLCAAGFTVIEPEHLSPKEIMEKTMGAEVVIGIEGSHLYHSVMTLAENGVLCCVQPPYRFTSTLKGQTDCLGMHYAVVVGHEEPGGFRVDMEELKLILDKIDVAVSQRALS